MNAVADELDKILERHIGAGRDSLIPILQEAQESQGFLSREAIIRIGRHLGLSASKVYGVATFYNQFRFQAPGKYEVSVCRGTACHVKGSAAVLEAIKRELKIEPGETTRDGAFNLEVVACMGVCGLSPVISVGGEYYAGVTPEKAVKIIRDYQRKTEDNDTANE